jgi:hypothetical protein
MYPEDEKGGRGKKSESRNLAEAAKFSYRRLNQARQVLDFSPDLAKSVLAGVTGLDDALAQAGELLKEMKESGARDSGAGGNRKSQSRETTVIQSAELPALPPATLKDLGITRDQSSQWQ